MDQARNSHSENHHAADFPSDLKVVCAWCGRVLKEGSGKTVSHHICPDCYDREVRPFIEERQRAKAEEFKPPPEDFEWMAFLEGLMHFSLAVGAVFFFIVMATEGLPWISGGRVPSLIEWIVEKPPINSKP